MKKAFFTFFLILFFIYCTDKKQNTISENNEIVVEGLLSKSFDINLNLKDRLQNADSLFQILQTRTNDSLTRFYYIKLANRYFNLQQQKKYREVCSIVYNYSVKSGDSLHLAKSLQYIGDYHYNLFVNDSAYFYYSKAEKLYKKLDNLVEVDRLKLYKANILFYEKDFSGCEAAIIDILKSVKNKNDYRLIYDCYITLGNALDGLNNSEKALEYYNKAFLITEKLNNDSQYILLKQQTYNYIGKIYQKDNFHLLAIDYFNKGLILDNTKSILYANLLNNLGYSKFKLSNKSAFKLLNTSLEIRNQLKSVPGVVSSKINLAEYFLKDKDTATAFANIKVAQNLAHNNHIYEDELKALRLLAKIDANNDSKYNNLFIKLTDSLYAKERAIRNKFARIEFETDEITVQKNTIEAEKNKISSQRWIILGFGIFFILIIGLLYVTKMQHAKNKELEFEKNQQKNNEEIYQLMLEQHNKMEEGRQAEKKRISQELHDGIMGKLSSTRLNLFVLSKKTDPETIQICLKHIDEIQLIEQEIRGISHNLLQDVFKTKDSFKMMMESLFESQQSISKVRFSLEIDPTIEWENIENKIKINIYRIFQEAIQNIHKYAKAKNCTAKISKEINHFYILIQDDGIGFDTEKEKSGIGLKNIRSRAKTIGGELDITSHFKLGTQLKLTIPYYNL